MGGLYDEDLRRLRRSLELQKSLVDRYFLMPRIALWFWEV